VRVCIRLFLVWWRRVHWLSRTAIRRLEREATLLRRVSNTYLVQLLSHGFSEAKDVFWLVMEHLEGSSLDVIMHDPDMRYIIYIYRCIYRLML